MRLLPVLALLLAASASAQAPAPGEVVVNEAMVDPPAPQPSGNEWVEVVNRSDRTVDLQGLAVGDSGAESDPVAASVPLAPGAFAVLVRNGDAFAAAYPGVPFVEVAGFPALNNGGDSVRLLLGATVLDQIDYTPSWGGSDASLERRDPAGPSTQANFGTSTDAAGGTPGAANSLFAPDETPPALLGAEAADATTVVLTFDEPLDRAGAETAANYNVDGGIGAPASASLTDAAEVTLTLAVALASPTTYTVTVTGVADEAGNALGSASASFFFGVGDVPEAGDLVVNEFLYDEPSADNPGEFVELLNTTADKTFDLRRFTLNDGTGNDEPVTEAAVFVGPGEYAVVVEDGALFAAVFPDVPFVEQPAWSALNNGGDSILLKADGATVDALTYEPSWGGEDASLERRDPAGPSSAAVNWATTADPRGGTPGAQNSRFEPDVTGPQLVAASASRDGRTVTVALDEPADPASVSATAFVIVDGPAVTEAAYDAVGPTVALSLDAPLAAGTSTVTASGLRDLIGNETASTSTTVAFVPDTVRPTIAQAVATSPTTVRVVFTEAVTAESAGAAAAYAVDGGVGAPASVAPEAASEGAEAVVLTFAAPLPERQVLTLTASGLTDLAGNVQPAATARLFLGAPDTPARGDVAITEVMFDPRNGSDGEYIELLNTTEAGIFDLRDLSLDGGEDALADDLTLLLPGQYLAVVRDAEGFQVVFPDVAFAEAGSEVGLSNSGETLRLTSAASVIDSVAYDPDWHRIELDDATGIALERRDPAGPSSAASNWSSSLDTERGGTPSATNTLGIAETPVERDGGITVTSPFAPDDGEAAEITATLGTEAALVRARIFDGGGRLVRELEPGRLSGSEAVLTWDGTGDGRQRLRAGIYVVLVEAVDAQGGTTEAHRAALVLARR
ncbi:MAG: lamin tail domain-containing protein [Bacteroidota bacterium]